MSDLSGVAPGGGEGNSAPIAVVTPAADTAQTLSISQAARALAAARHKPKEQPAEAAPAEAAPAETELAETPNDAQPAAADPVEPTETPEPAETPPIEPPRSWTKAEKERFQSLPRETQEYLHTREQERDRDIRRSQNEAAEKLKALEAEKQQAEQARQKYEQSLPALMQALHEAQNGTFADVKTVDDVSRLAQEDPFRYLQWQAHQTKLQAVNSELERAKGEQERERLSQWNQHIQRENELAAEYIPELADKSKAAELTARAVEHLHELGFKDEELAKLASGEKLSIYDHRLQRLIFNNLKFTEAKASAAKPLPKPVPPVQRPGVAKPAGAAASEALQALTTKLERTGSLKDAQALRAAQLRARA